MKFTGENTLSRTHRLRRPHWQLAVATLDAVLREPRAADQRLQEAFRAHREMGGRDRANVTDLVYGVLRDAPRLQAIAQSPDDAAALAAVQALETHLASAEELLALGCSEAPALAARVAAFDPSSLSPAQWAAAPEAVWQAWCRQYGELEARALGDSLRLPAPVDLRVNTLRTTRAAARAALEAQGIACSETSRSPLGLRLPRRAALQGTALFREGGVEPQDEGSQLLALLVEAQPGERIADWCAGAGGKTLALAAQMQDRGELWACDLHASRLARLAPRLQRAGVHCVRTQLLAAEASAAPAALQALDAVLVDAPCSGSGTWRRQPELRLRTPDLAALAALQGRILAQAATAVRPGGRLVYGTCSVFAEENDAVVEAFLAAHPQFREEPAGEVYARQGVVLPDVRLRLLPHRHGSDGFFAARLRRMG